MKNFIVLDLEWNQSPDGKEGTIDHFPFEIIEIGAVRLDEKRQPLNTFPLRFLKSALSSWTKIERKSENFIS